MENRGKTTAGTPVYGGIFELWDTYGVPIEVTLDRFSDATIDWEQYFTEVDEAGQYWSTHVTRIKQALMDSPKYTREYAEGWEDRVKLLIIKLGETND